MILRRLLASGFLVGLVVGSALSASAHMINEYPSGNGWKYTILNRVFRTAPNLWQTSYNTRVDAAMATWTALAGSSLSQQRGSQAASDTWMCGTAYDFLVSETPPNGSLASTTLCVAANSTVRIRVNPSATWYTGSTTPNPAGTYDLQGLLSHELGHAHQAWQVCTMGTMEPCPGGHYDTTNNFPLCDTSTPAQLHTMCRSISQANSWRWRSLETHDRDLAEFAY